MNNKFQSTLAACSMIIAIGMIASLVFGGVQPMVALAQTDGWVVNPANGNEYRLTEPMSWFDAEAQAQAWGGHLVTLDNVDEEWWLKDTFGRDEYFWIGFNDTAQEGTWVWSSGAPVGYTNWDIGEPNNCCECTENPECEDAAVMNWLAATEGGPYGDYWNDLDPYNGFRGIIERDVEHGEWIAIPVTGHQYQVIYTRMSWHAAGEYCQGIDAHLVTISSIEENQFVYDLQPYSWLGATDELCEGTWLWVTGEPWDFEYWAPGEPNNCCPEENCGGSGCTPEHYLTFWGAPYSSMWNDVPDGRKPFVCEKDVILVDIDIKPGSYPNSIRLAAKGVVPVAVLSDLEFDAASVDPVTVVFAGAAPVRWVMEDVDYDGDMDLLFHFKIEELELDEYSVEAILTGKTFAGMNIQGVDTIKIVP